MALSICAAKAQDKLLETLPAGSRPLNAGERWFAEEMCAAGFLPHEIARHIRAIRRTLQTTAEVCKALGLASSFESEVCSRLAGAKVETQQIIAIILGMRRRRDEAELRLKKRNTSKRRG